MQAPIIFSTYIQSRFKATVAAAKPIDAPVIIELLAALVAAPVGAATDTGANLLSEKALVPLGVTAWDEGADAGNVVAVG